MAALQAQLAQTPAEVVVINHCLGMWELAALHLSLQPPQLADAALAIDAVGAVLDRLQGRLGDGEATVRDALAQLRLAFVQVSAAPAPPPAGRADGSSPPPPGRPAATPASGQGEVSGPAPVGGPNDA